MSKICTKENCEEMAIFFETENCEEGKCCHHHERDKKIIFYCSDKICKTKSTFCDKFGRNVCYRHRGDCSFKNINILCIIKNCYNIPEYGYLGSGPLFCALHRNDETVEKNDDYDKLLKEYLESDDLFIEDLVCYLN